MAGRAVVDVRDINPAVVGGGCMIRDGAEDPWMGVCCLS